MRALRRLVFGVFAAVGVLTVLLIVAGGLALSWLRPSARPLPDNIVLNVDLTRGLSDGPAGDRLLQLVVGGKPTLRDFLDTIETAAGDSRVKGLVARLGDDEFGLGQTQQLRDAIAAFRAKGKFAMAFADSFGEFGPGTRPYYLATAFDRIWLQPMGDVGLTGLYSDVTFLKGTFDLLGVVPQFDHREQYKTAMNSLTETSMTLPQRDEISSLLASMGGQIVGGIAAGRKLSPEAVRQAIDHGPLLANEARQSGLVDRLGYLDEALAAARMRAGNGAQVVRLTNYRAASRNADRDGGAIALIYGNGLIVRGNGSVNPLAAPDVMGADEVSRAFRAAIRDPKVRAILFRIDSPGGSVVASETIWREVVLARRRGKPVVVSMGDVAGSGGYYIAAAADKIVAEPATLTGSIGVLAGKLAIGKLLAKLGISTDSAQLGANAGMFSPTSEFSVGAHARLEAFLDEAYRGFKQHVGDGRHLTPEAVEAVAKGRVWTGEQAKAKGLVDALGGYEVAIALAKEMAKIPADTPVELTVFPRPEGPIELLYNRLTGQPRDDGAAAGPIGQAIAAATPLIQRLAALVDEPGVLTMPPISPPR
jgi:protease IV